MADSKVVRVAEEVQLRGHDRRSRRYRTRIFHTMLLRLPDIED